MSWWKGRALTSAMSMDAEAHDTDPAQLIAAE